MKKTKSIRQIITDLNVIRSNNCSKEKSEEIKGVIQDLIPYAEEQEERDAMEKCFKDLPGMER